MERQKRERAVNFTADETDLLVSLLRPKKYILENKKSGASTWFEKDKAWKEIAVAFNRYSGTVFREPKHLKLKYEGLKRDTRRKIAALSNGYKNMEGPSALTAAEEKVKNILLSVHGDESNSNWDLQSSDSKAVYDTGDDEDSAALDADSDLWGFFEEMPQNRAKCTMCGVVLGRKADAMYKHLRETHSKVFENLQAEDDMSENYEAVYIEDPIDLEPSPKRLKHNRTDTEPFKINTTHNIKDTQDEEMDSFAKYIAGLLSDVPEKACMKLQVDIVNLIMNAKMNAQETNRTETFEEPDMENTQGNSDDTELENSDHHIEIQIEPEKPKALPRKRLKSTNNKLSTNIKKDKEMQIEHFGKYVSCLLKTVPDKELEAKLQIDVINLIMAARLGKSKTTPSTNIIDNRENT